MITINCITSEEQYDAAQNRIIELTNIENLSDLQKIELKSLAALSSVWEKDNFLPPL